MVPGDYDSFYTGNALITVCLVYGSTRPIDNVISDRYDMLQRQIYSLLKEL